MRRLIILSLLFLLSLLCFTSAPTYHLWMLAILVTEYPLVFLLLTVVTLLLVFGPNKYNKLGTIIGLMALLQFSFPVLMSYRISGRLNNELTVAFGPDNWASTAGKSEPFHFLQMIEGMNAKQVTYSTKQYAVSSGMKLTLDYYLSQSSGKKPCVIVVHGGSWAGGDSRQLPELNSVLARRGYNVASINYRLAPQFQFPAPVTDLKEAISYLKQNAAQLSIDTNNFILLGRSAGAQIALLAAYTFHDPCIKGVVSFYGPADMVWGYSLPANPLVMDSRKVIEDYLGGTYVNVPKNYFASSPVESVTAGAPPTLMIHGPNDPLVAYEHNLHLIKKLKEFGIKYYLLTLPAATHGCDYTLNGPSGQLSSYTVIRFLESVTKRP